MHALQAEQCCCEWPPQSNTKLEYGRPFVCLLADSYYYEQKCRTPYIASPGETCQEIADTTGWPSALVYHLNPQCDNLVRRAQLCLFTSSWCGVGLVVKAGDTCDNIATSYGLTIAGLKDLNPAIRCEALVPHQQVLCAAKEQPGAGHDA